MTLFWSQGLFGNIQYEKEKKFELMVVTGDDPPNKNAECEMGV